MSQAGTVRQHCNVTTGSPRQHEAEEERQREAAELKRREAEEARLAKAASKVTPEEGRHQFLGAMLERMEGSKGSKRTRAESEDGVGETIVGAIMVRNGVMWVVREGKECGNCMSGHKKCLWRDGVKDTGRRATACYHCNHSKKSCGSVRDVSETVEGSGPKKRGRTTAEKGKGKEKEVKRLVASGSKSSGPWSWGRLKSLRGSWPRSKGCGQR